MKLKDANEINTRTLALDIKENELHKQINEINRERLALFATAIHDGFVWQSSEKKWFKE